MKKIYVSFLVAALLSAIGSCNIINPSEVVPTYVRIDSFTFQNDVVRGSTSHKVTNVWVYYNRAAVGNFDLPAQFPVIATEEGRLTVIPGIDFDGLSGYPLIYPLYRADTLHIKPSPGTVIPFNAKTGYIEASILKFEERFDNGAGRNNSFIRRSGDTTIFNTNEPGMALEGGGPELCALMPDLTLPWCSVALRCPFWPEVMPTLNWITEAPATYELVCILSLTMAAVSIWSKSLDLSRARVGVRFMSALLAGYLRIRVQNTECCSGPISWLVKPKAMYLWTM